jgi:hypothetical protein
MVQFNTRIQITLNAIKKNPGIFPLSTKNREIRKAYIDRNNLLFYMFDNNNRKIYLLTFFDCRQDPNKLISKY